MPSITGFGSEWDQRRAQTKFWVQLDNGAGYAGFGDELPRAKLDLQAQLEEIGLPLPQLGHYGEEIARQILEEARPVERLPGDYAELMKHGAPVTVEFLEGPSTGTVAVEQVGTLLLTSGRVCAFDPFGLRGEPFARSVAAGTYPVYVSWAEIEGEPRRRSIAAWVQFSSEAVARWEPDGTSGCGVDSGSACFADADVETPEEETDRGFEESAQCGDHMVAFATGWGDGHYSCFWGLDARDAAAVLLMDVDLVRRN